MITVLIVLVVLVILLCIVCGAMFAKIRTADERLRLAEHVAAEERKAADVLRDTINKLEALDAKKKAIPAVPAGLDIGGAAAAFDRLNRGG